MVEPIKRYECFHREVNPQLKTLFFILIGTTKKYNKSGSTKMRTTKGDYVKDSLAIVRDTV